MLESYMNNFESILSTMFFASFKIILIILIILLIISLLMLAVACLIKSQNLKSKFLIVVPSLLVGTIFLLALPYIFVYIKSLM